MRRSFFSIALALLVPWPLCVPSALHACGITTHVEVTQRAAAFFEHPDESSWRDIIHDHPEALQAGASFPDWGYILPDYGDAAEAAHWDPFLQAAANHVYVNYPQPWDEETEEFIAFLFGTTQHSVADISWHGLGVDEGFIDMLAAQDTAGDWDDAHDMADVGGDLLGAYELSQAYMESVWIVPTADLVEVYHGLGYDDVTRAAINAGMMIIALGGHAERLAGQLLYPSVAAKGPTMTEAYQDYFVGGLDDMGVSSAWKFLEVIDWMEEGVEAASDRPVPDPAHTVRLGPIMRLGLELEKAGAITLTREESDRVLRIVVRTNTEAWLKFAAEYHSKHKVTFTPQTQSPTIEAREHSPAPSIHFTVDTPYSHLGTSLAAADFDGDGIDDLAMGAPGFGPPGTAQQGAVYVFMGEGDAENGTIELSDQSADIVLTGATSGERLGYSLAAGDFDGDGFSDLAVGAPTHGASSLEYTGKVSLYRGSAAGLEPTPALTYASGAVYDNFGHGLSAGDVNGDGFDDLIVSSPFSRGGGVQRGLAALFLGDASLFSKDSPPTTLSTQEGSMPIPSPEGRRAAGHLPTDPPRAPSADKQTPPAPAARTLEDADALLYGEHDYDWFGMDVALARVPEIGTFLLIGAPSADQEGKAGAGALYGYLYGELAQPRFIVKGDEEFLELGHAVEAGTILEADGMQAIVSAPGAVHGRELYAGRVYVFNIDELEGSVDLGDVAASATFIGEGAGARFGWSLGLADVDGDGTTDLYCGAPFRSSAEGVEVGAGYFWIAPTLNGGGLSYPSVSATSIIQGSIPGARLGSEFAVLKGGTHPLIALSARQSDEAAPSAGTVSLWTDLFTDQSSASGQWR